MGIYTIKKPLVIQGITGAAAQDANSRFEFYLGRLIKLIPAEIIGLYLCLYSIGNSEEGYKSPEDDIWLSAISIISLACLIIFRIFGTKESGFKDLKSFSTIQLGSILISSLSFIIWLYAMGNEFAGIEAPSINYVKASVVVWTFIVPIFYKPGAQ